MFKVLAEGLGHNLVMGLPHPKEHDDTMFLSFGTPQYPDYVTTLPWRGRRVTPEEVRQFGQDLIAAANRAEAEFVLTHDPTSDPVG